MGPRGGLNKRAVSASNLWRTGCLERGGSFHVFYKSVFLFGENCLRERQYDDMPEDEARTLLEDALRVCYYRDKQSINKFQMSKVTKDGATISEPYALATAWHYQAFVNPTAAAIGSW